MKKILLALLIAAGLGAAFVSASVTTSAANEAPKNLVEDGQ